MLEAVGAEQGARREVDWGRYTHVQQRVGAVRRIRGSHARSARNGARGVRASGLRSGPVRWTRCQGRDASTAWSEMYLRRVVDVFVMGMSWACRGRVVGMSWACGGRVVGAWLEAHREKLEQSMARDGSSS